MNLSKSLAFLGNFCKDVKICQFSSEIIFRQLLQTFGNFFLVTLVSTPSVFFYTPHLLICVPLIIFSIKLTIHDQSIHLPRYLVVNHLSISTEVLVILTSTYSISIFLKQQTARTELIITLSLQVTLSTRFEGSRKRQQKKKITKLLKCYQTQ